MQSSRFQLSSGCQGNPVSDEREFGDLLDVLGRYESERVATLTRLLRNSTEHELNELLSAFQQAIARLAEGRNPLEEDTDQDAPGRS